MDKKLIDLSDEANNIGAILEVIDGGMSFLSGVIDDMESHPEVSALCVKNGIIQKKLNAINSLLIHQLSQIEESQENISNVINEERTKRKQDQENENNE